MKNVLDIEIRNATVSDFNKVFEMIKEFSAFIGTPEKVIVTPEQMMKDSDFFNCIIAVYNGSIVGYATYFFAYYSWVGKSLYLDDLYVKEQYRGRKIGTKLFDKIINISQMTHCRRVRWQVHNWNKKAMEFYKKRGAMIDEVEMNCDLLL